MRCTPKHRGYASYYFDNDDDEDDGRGGVHGNGGDDDDGDDVQVNETDDDDIQYDHDDTDDNDNSDRTSYTAAYFSVFRHRHGHVCGLRGVFLVSQLGPCVGHVLPGDVVPESRALVTL